MSQILKLKTLTLTIGKKEYNTRLSKILDYSALMWISKKNKIKILFFYIPKIFVIPGFKVDYFESILGIRFVLLFSIVFMLKIKKLYINPVLLNIILQLLLITIVWFLLIKDIFQ